MSPARRIEAAKVARPVEITFANGEAIELSPEQYAALVARIALDLCKDCPRKGER